MAPILADWKYAILAALEPDDPPVPRPAAIVEIGGRRWERKTDASGRPGRERVSLRGWEAWWRRARFEDLPPVPMTLFQEAAKNDLRRAPRRRPRPVVR